MDGPFYTGHLASLSERLAATFLRNNVPPSAFAFSLTLLVMHVQLFTNTAGALPAEMGPDGKLAKRRQGFQFPSPSKAASAWQRRMAGQRSQQSAPQE